jgi:superfamily II DNA or RNA helicase
MRRNLIENMISNTRAINDDLHVLGISATPVINNLNEAVSLLQMIVGDKFEYLNTSPTIYNCLDIHKKLILHGVRYIPKYDIGIEKVYIEVNGYHLLDKLKGLKTSDILKMERILINDKLHAVKNELTTGTIIYTHYVAGIVPYIKNFLRSQNLTYAEYTGENKDDLQKFINGDVDILIGSSTIGTGLDGLQKVCNKLIILNLPWTHAAYIQLLGRIYRQGSIYDKIKVIIPQILFEHEGDIWSYDKYRIDKIGFKKTLGDAVLDGVFPEEKISSPSVMFAEAIKALNNWIARVENKPKTSNVKSKAPACEV